MRTMSLRVFSASVAVVAALVAAAPARAEPCDAMLAGLDRRGEEIMKREATGAALCAGLGQLLGVMQSVRIVAGHCIKDEDKRTKGIGVMNGIIEGIEAAIKGQCT